MKKFYNEEEKNIIEKLTKKYLLICFGFLFLFLVSETVLILLSTYELRILFKILVIVVGVLIVFPGYLFFAVYYVNQRRFEKHYKSIFESDAIEYSGYVSNVSTQEITMNDYQRVFSITLKTDEREEVFYLNSQFDINSFNENKKVKIEVFNKYIKSFEELK